MAAMPYCQHCGQEVTEDARWCRNCGQALTSPAPGMVGLPAYQAPAAAVVRPAPGNATASLVLGIAGLLVCPVVCSVLALVFGYQAKGQLRSDPTLQGAGMA